MFMAPVVIEARMMILCSITVITVAIFVNDPKCYDYDGR